MKRRTLLTGAAAASIAPFVATEGASANMTEPTPHFREFTGGTASMTAPSTADGFFQMFQDKNDMVWSSGDQVTSFKHNNHIYWLFGDSMLGGEDPDGSFADGTVMVGNRILRQSGTVLYHAVPASGNGSSVPDPAVHNDTNQERYWTQGMFAANGHLYVLCQRVRNNSGGSFTPMGGEIAKFTQNTTTGDLTLVAMISTPATAQEEVPGPYGIQWCSDAVVCNGYVYIYGATRAEGNPWVLHFSYVARVPVAHLENPYAWRFYKKTTGTWVSKISELDPDKANQTDAIVGSQVSSVRYINGMWRMIHKPWNGWGSDVKVVSSTTPYGPWGSETVVFSSPAGTHEGLNYETYSPQFHPEQTLLSGKTLVSIAWNGEGLTLEQMFQNADLYKPRFYEVQF